MTCASATVFTLTDGQLFADGRLVGTHEGALYQQMLERPSDQQISSGFSIVDGILKWRHPKFNADPVIFCLSTSNIVLAVFDPSSIPSCLCTHKPSPGAL